MIEGRSGEAAIEIGKCGTTKYGGAQTLKSWTLTLRSMVLFEETVGSLRRIGESMKIWLVVLIAATQLVACGRGGANGVSCPPSAAPGPHNVTLTWAPNREKGVNSAGGGYHVSISGQPTLPDVTFNGTTTPTSTTAILQSGCYTVTVTAFAELDAQGGLTGSVSAPSQALAVNVP